MSKVQINNVVVHNNPAMFKSDFHFDITFDCMENLVVRFITFSQTKERVPDIIRFFYKFSIFK